MYNRIFFALSFAFFCLRSPIPVAFANAISPKVGCEAQVERAKILKEMSSLQTSLYTVYEESRAWIEFRPESKAVLREISGAANALNFEIEALKHSDASLSLKGVFASLDLDAHRVLSRFNALMASFRATPGRR